MSNKPLRFLGASSATRWGASIYKHIAHHIDRFVFRISGGRTTFSAWTIDVPVIMVTVPGRKSGIPRTSPLAGIPHPDLPDAYYVVASGWGRPTDPAWYLNLMAAGEATVSLGGVARTYTARDLQGEAHANIWPYLDSLLPNYALYREIIGETRKIPVVLLTPKQEAVS